MKERNNGNLLPICMEGLQEDTIIECSFLNDQGREAGRFCGAIFGVGAIGTDGVYAWAKSQGFADAPKWTPFNNHACQI